MAPAVSALVGLSSLAVSLAALALAALERRRARAEAGRLDALAERVARLETPGPVSGTGVATVRPRTPAPTSPAPTLRSDPGHPATGPTLISVPDLSSPTGPGASAEASAALGRRFAAVWELADAGATAEAIARATGQPVGQVELILGLRRPRVVSRHHPSRGEPNP